MSALDRVLVIGGSSGIGFEVARQEAALDSFFSTLHAIDHLVSMVGDSMAVDS
jgi:hypothetical protein